MQSYLSKSGFWDQDAQRVALPSMSMSATAQYGLAPQGASQSQDVYGRVPGGQCVRCSDARNYGVCGGVDKSTGKPLPWRECRPSEGMLFNCYYAAPQSQAKCYGSQRRAMQVAAAASEPFDQLLRTTADQPSYMEAVQTMYAGLI